MSTNSYSLSGYGEMIADRVRIDAYVRALRQSVQPGAVVMDIGTGPGIMAVLACQLGASRVYAIESDEIIQVARQIAAANGCADKIEFIEDLSTKVTTPVRADVIVSDMRGVLPLYAHHIESIADARRRFLAPTGILIPQKDTIWASIIEAPERYARIVDPWERCELNQDFTAVRRMIVNDLQKARFKPEQLLSEPKLWATIDYTNVDSPDFQGSLNWTIERAGTGHGMAVWFDTQLADDVGFSNAPGAPEAIYGSMMFPWMNPVPLAAGQRVCIDLQAKLLEDDYFWRWTTKIASVDSPNEVLAGFDQSQLLATVRSLSKLRKGASDYIPRLSEEGRVRQKALELMDGQTSLEEIARRLAIEFPKRFSRWQRALTFAGELSKQSSL
jgi:protein arginine N-methyltransferase 1